MLCVQISDPHVNPIGERYPKLYGGLVDTADVLQRTVRAVNALVPRPDVVIVTGDVAALEGMPADYEAARAILDGLAMPYLPIPGNHDRRVGMRAAFRHLDLFGADGPLCYRRRFADVDLIGLDSLAEGADFGSLARDQLDWAEAEIEAAGDRPVVIFLHHPPFVSGWPFAEPIRAFGGEQLEAIVFQFPNVAGVLCGHLHRTIVRRFGGAVGFAAPAAGRQNSVELRPDFKRRWTDEGPAFVQHLLHAGELTSFVVPLEATEP